MESIILYIILGLIVLVIYLFLESRKNKNKLNGELRETKSDGSIIIRYYIKGILHGECRTIDRFGNLKYVFNFNNGKREGPTIDYNYKGIIIEKGLYKNNEKVGIWKRYYDDGAIKSIEEFDDNSKSISSIHYFENGRVNFERRDNFLISYYENGVLEKRTEHSTVGPAGYDCPTYYKEYYESSVLKEERLYEDENQNRYINKYYQRIFHKNGVLKSEGMIEGANFTSRRGIWKFYDENGVLINQVNCRETTNISRTIYKSN